MEELRKVDIDKLSLEQFIEVENFLSSKTREILQKASEELNRHLNIYDLEAFLGLQIVKKGEANLFKERLVKTHISESKEEKNNANPQQVKEARNG